MILQILKYVVLIILVVYMLNQVRKPTRWVGQFFAWVMNQSHSRVTDKGISHIIISKEFTILDVGCGGGKTINKLAMLAPEGKVYGIDYAKGSINVSRRFNASLIREGRVEIREASVSALPFPDDMFDLVTAVETHYYWPDLTKDFAEIRRVLKPDGTFLLIAESYKKGKYDKLQRPVMKVLRSMHLSLEEHRELLMAVGYTDVQAFEEKGKGWMCTVSKK